MIFRIETPLFHTFPALSVFVFRACGVRSALRMIDTEKPLADALHLVKAEYSNSEALSASTLVTEWREVYRQQGVKLSQFRSSIEALARRVVADKPIATGVPLVDFYNLHSLHHQACLGGYDMGKLPDGEIVLRLCDVEHDKFTPLGGTATGFPLNPKLAVYALKSEILCWGFNCRDSAMTALDENTDDALFLAEAVTIGQKKRGRAALNAMVERLANAGASVSNIFSADAKTPQIEIKEVTQ